MYDTPQKITKICKITEKKTIVTTRTQRIRTSHTQVNHKGRMKKIKTFKKIFKKNTTHTAHAHTNKRKHDASERNYYDLIICDLSANEYKCVDIIIYFQFTTESRVGKIILYDGWKRTQEKNNKNAGTPERTVWRLCSD